MHKQNVDYYIMTTLIIFSSILLSSILFLFLKKNENNLINDQKELFSTEIVLTSVDDISLIITDEKIDKRITIKGYRNTMKQITTDGKTYYFEYSLTEDKSLLTYWVFVVKDKKQIFAEQLVAKLKDSWGNNLIQ
ncbi:MAG: hypothetical protein C0601_01630 [Candidatus Muiribacterium halophilum]|uniref:Uncharacterized protein n=1 Tax=Muiribacterium halophilum TaxID=2053465 RepID=A0A2N5ZLU9_MUIH1|nr:MAG: hypothetical protein C0601_01630 [Candidatus Muirbacterium halophilum]